ncbi:MAG: hypothetical protein U0176_15065 [Bacteroidia bacterium]
MFQIEYIGTATCMRDRKVKPLLPALVTLCMWICSCRRNLRKQAIGDGEK